MNLLFWYQFYCGFSGTAMIDYWLMIFFNLFFTSTPPIMFGIMDKDVSAEMLMGVPDLYRTGQGSGVSKRRTEEICYIFICMFHLNTCVLTSSGIQFSYFLDFHAGCFLSKSCVLFCSIFGKNIFFFINLVVQLPLQVLIDFFHIFYIFLGIPGIRC